MAELTFKTNINCGGCLAKVTPALDAETKISDWKVNLTDDDRTLTVISSDITPEEVIKVVSSVGFEVEFMKPINPTPNQLVS
ncbi:MAG: heavy-metal-associated domain-containing protein [Bacteroidia bacterium]|nr:heavy-metal-associated domain-containing protein [Bacteroidia bacterium]